MANPDQKTILIEETSKDIIKICKKFQADSGSSDSEVKNLLTELARLWQFEEKIHLDSDINMSHQLNS